MADRSDRAAGEAWLHQLEQLAVERGFIPARWGESEGLPLLGLRRPARGPGPRIYVSAGIHGDEPAGPLAIERLLRLDLFDRRAAWTVCPLLNPGGWLAGTRETPAGVDLNRDYHSPRSPEVAAHRLWLREVGPHDLYLSLHEDWETTGFYLYEINTSCYPPLAARILEEVAEVIPLEPLECIDQHAVCARGYIAHRPEPDEPLGWPEAIYHIRLYPHLSYTFETPSGAEMDERVAAHVVATRTAMEVFFQNWEGATGENESGWPRAENGSGRS
jgi:murein peptide amidase A